MLKKYIPAIIFLLMFSILLILTLYSPLYFDKYLAKSKDLSSIIEIGQHIEDPKMMIPSYDMDPNNPYLYAANEAVSLERSKQYGKWDGYHVIITPTKLSDLTPFQIAVSCRASEESNSDLEWTKKNVTADFTSDDHYPIGEYTHYMGTFHQDAYFYEVTAFVFGPVDDTRDGEIIEELQYLIDGFEN